MHHPEQGVQEPFDLAQQEMVAGISILPVPDGTVVHPTAAARTHDLGGEGDRSTATGASTQQRDTRPAVNPTIWFLDRTTAGCRQTTSWPFP